MIPRAEKAFQAFPLTLARRVCFNMVPSLGIELSSQAYKTRASPFML